MAPKTVEITFYRENDFEDAYNFFACWGVRIYGSMTRFFDEEHEYGYFEIQNASNTSEVIQNCKHKKSSNFEISIFNLFRLRRKWTETIPNKYHRKRGHRRH
jgi:hypothetical protein